MLASCKKNPIIINSNPVVSKPPVLIENYTPYTWGDEVPCVADSTITGNVNNTNIIIDNTITVQPTRINGDTIYFKVPNTVINHLNGLQVSVNGKKSNQVSLTLALPQLATNASVNLVYGGTLTINGQYFNPVLANNVVMLGKLKLTVISATKTQLVVKDDTSTISSSGGLTVTTGVGLSVPNGVTNKYYRYLRPQPNFPGTARTDATTVTVNGIVYFGLGKNAASTASLYDWWKYDPTSSTWTVLTTCPTGGYNIISFVIGGKVYVLSNTALFIYDTSSDTWASGAAFPGGDLFGGTGFGSEQFGYVVCGQQQNQPGVQEVNFVWRYDQQLDSWKKLANFPGSSREHAMSLTLNNSAYVIGGYAQVANNFYVSEMWKFDLTTEKWSQSASLPSGAGLTGSFVFTSNNKIYSGGGTISDEIGESNFIYEYTPSTNTWTLKERILDPINYGAAATSVNNVGYIISGQQTSFPYDGGSQYFFKFMQ